MTADRTAALRALLAALPDAGDWTPSRVIHLARASEVDAVVAAVNALPALLDEVEALRAALEGLDAPMQWLNDHYPKAMVEMPTHTSRAFAKARAALAAARRLIEEGS